MAEPIKRLHSIFLPLDSELLFDGPTPSVDIVKEFELPFHPDRNAMYIGKVSQMPVGMTGLTCALIGDAPLLPEQEKGNNILLFPPEVEPATLFDKIETYFAGRILFSRKSEAIVNAYLRKERLDSVFGTAFGALDRPMRLCDTAFNTLACGNDMGLARRDEWDIPAMYPARVEDDTWSIDGHSRIFRLDNQKYDERDILVSIEDGEAPIAYLLISSEGKPFEYWEKELISIIVEILEAKLSDAANSPRQKNRPYERFIIHLLDNSMESAETIESGAGLIGMSTRGYFSLLLVNISQYHQMFTDARVLRDTLVSIAGGYSVIYEDRIIILLQHSSEQEYREQDTEAIEQCLRQNKLYGTASRLFFSLDEAHKHYAKAKKLLTLHFCAPEDRYFLSVEGMGLFPVVDALLKTEDKEDILEPIVRALSEMDSIKNTSYIETLYTYLGCSKNPSMACKKLFIHRNTLDYRIQRITKLTGIDWNDGDLLFRLYLSINILRFIRDRDNAQ